MNCPFGMYGLQSFLDLFVFDCKLVLVEVPLSPFHPNLFLPSLDDVLLNACSLLFLDGGDFVGHEFIGFFLGIVSDFVSLKNSLEVALLPAMEEVVILIVRKRPLKLVA